MKRVDFSDHALERLARRGGGRDEVELTLRNGEMAAARAGRLSFRKNFPFQNMWKGRYYETKQVIAIVVEEPERFVVVTVYVFFFGESAQ